MAEPIKLGYGLRTHPSLSTGWGARWIYPNDLVWDRQDIQGPNRDALREWLEGGALRAALVEALAAAKSWRIFQDKSEDITLYSDDRGTIVGNPQRSYGYLYVAGWLYEDVIS